MSPDASKVSRTRSVALSEIPPSATKALTCMQTSQVLSASSRLDFEASASICDTSCRCAGSDM